MSSISVILPVLNEGSRITPALSQLAALRLADEIIVVDGGSTDDTVTLAKSTGLCVVVEATPGRGSQMNAGAALAGGEVLLFLHADVSLPDDAGRHIREALSDPRVVAGAFKTWTISESTTPRWSCLLHLADMRSRYTGLPYGDQAIFVRASAFRRLGGFPEIPIMEDVELVRRLRQMGHIETVSASVRVSGRRLFARPIYYFLAMNLIPLLYRLGVSPHRLAAFYGIVR